MGKCLDAARKYIAEGFAPIPISDQRKENGELLKAPYASVLPEVNGSRTWTPFQARQPTEEETDRMWHNGAFIGVACGIGSRNLEVIDFDEPGYFDAWEALVEHELFQKLTIMATPSGGKHVWYRTAETPEGNQVLARTKQNTVAIETRGQGGYVLCAPTLGYSVFQGSVKTVPTITAEEREDMLAAARMLHQGDRQERGERASTNPSIKRPGDRYAAENTWRAILEPLGWTESHKKGQNTYWTRPGKKRGTSASTNGEDGCFYCFTTNAHPLNHNEAYTKFGFYAQINFQGDFYAAAQYLNKENPKAQQKRAEYIAEVEDREERQWATLSTIQPKKIEWLWEPYIPNGLVTLVYGDGGIGKSTALLAVATALSLGVPLPGQSSIVKGKTIILSAEDPPDTVLVPRLQSLEADLTQIIAPLEFDAEGRANPMVLDECGMESLYRQAVKVGARLIVIDPALAYFEATKDTNSALDVRAFMRALAKVAHDAECAIVLISHTNKSSASAAQYRAVGSKQFVDASRSAIYAVADPEDPNNCALIHTKHNLSPKGKTLGYTWRDGVFGWTGESDLTAADAAEVPKATKIKKGAIDEAKAWIIETLEQEGEVKALEMYEGAKLNGINAAALKRAKEDLKDKVRSNKRTDGSWTWSLRATATTEQPYWAKDDPYYEL